MSMIEDPYPLERHIVFSRSPEEKKNLILRLAERGVLPEVEREDSMARP